MFRCEVIRDGKRCLLSPAHVGKVPCRFEPKAPAPQPKGLTPAQAFRRARKELRKPELPELRLVIPLIPPSVNHYKLPRANGRGYYVTAEAKAFKSAVACLTKGSVRAEWYEITVTVYLGKAERRDADNCGKVVFDALVEARIILTDMRVKPQIIPERDWDNPRTEIIVKEWKRIKKDVCRKEQGRAEEGNTCLETPGTCESCPDWWKRGK